MRILFLGTPQFAVASLKILHENGYDIAAVVTMPDKQGGRGNQIIESDVKKYALEHQLHLLQPPKLKDPDFLASIKALDIDLGVVVAFRMMPEALWSMPRLGTLNLHGSLLPQYRGAAPINWAIINGEKKTGCTTFFLKHEIDTGNIIDSFEVPIHDTTDAGELHDTLMYRGAELLLSTVKSIERNDYTETAQDLSLPIQHAPKIHTDTCQIDWQNDLHNIYNLIRGLSPYPAAFTFWQGKKLKIYKTQREETTHAEPIGGLHTDHHSYLKVAVHGGFLHLLELQLEGKKRMPIRDFLNGNKVEPNTQL